MKVTSYLLTKLLENQKKEWEKELSVVNFEYNLVCLNDKQMQQIQEKRTLLPKYIAIAQKLINKISER